MNNLLTSMQMHEADRNVSISSIDLMERAAQEFTKALIKRYAQKSISISILCGQGNNGGDGLAVARLLHKEGYKNISVYLIEFGTTQSKDRAQNLQRLEETTIKPQFITEPEQFEDRRSSLIIDAILGSGLNKPLTDKYKTLIKRINALGRIVVAVDVPTGFPSEGPIGVIYDGIKANLVISFQLPKINFFFPESVLALDCFEVVNIGLDEDFIANRVSEWKLIEKPIIKARANFSHKGTYGHALLIAGNTETMGAALLAATACLRVGTGLTTLCLHSSGLTSLNATLPEVMALVRDKGLAVEALKKYTAIAIGPGLGLQEETELLLMMLVELKKPMILDADALNILAKRKDVYEKLSQETILTPHLKEFDRLFGEHESWWCRVQTARKEAKDRNIIIVLKNQYTFVCLPNGEVHINQTGNPGMASGGMGDVLTGMIAGFLAQGHSPANAAKLAVYAHGKAGDELARKRFTISASEIANQIPKTLKKLVGN